MHGICLTLISQINDAAAGSNCVYPKHSTPACVNGNPCGFECTDGFTPFPASNPTKCVCKSHNVVCNGQCVPAKACPSSHPRKEKGKRWVGSGSCTDNGPGWLACGVLGGGRHAWECVDAARDLESCMCLCLCHSMLFRKLTDYFCPSPLLRWWMRVPPYGLLSHWQGLLVAPWRR